LDGKFVSAAERAVGEVGRKQQPRLERLQRETVGALGSRFVPARRGRARTAGEQFADDLRECRGLEYLARPVQGRNAEYSCCGKRPATGPASGLHPPPPMAFTATSGPSPSQDIRSFRELSNRYFAKGIDLFLPDGYRETGWRRSDK